MPLIKLNNAHLAYGHVPLLDGVDFLLDAGERVALIGRNGSGKSSMLKAMATMQPNAADLLDDGERWFAPGITVAYVAQEPPLDGEMTVFEAVVAGMGDVSRHLAEFHNITLQLSKLQATTGGADSHHQDESAALIARMTAVQHQLEALDGWNLQARAEQVIDRFGLVADTLVATLSGGGKKRVALAQALAMAPDVLLLDEPTNHLDISAILWLEELLLASQASILFVTHDRSFLERLATRIVELDRGKLSSFPGNYAEYQRRKESLLHEESLAQARADKLLKQEEIWIRKGVEARRTRAVFRIQRLEKLRAQRAARLERVGTIKIQVDSGDAGGQLVAELKHVCKSFADRLIVNDFSARILRGDKIGLIGPNGIGKTTLLRLLLGEIKADSGEVRRGTRLEIAYFDQFRAQLDPEACLIDIISPGSDTVTINGKSKHVISYLEDFLFPPERSRSVVKSLSGGERNRLLLARLFAQPANVLVLDEPTNDLDIETLELLEQLLQDYEGTLFLVSHDRVFLDNVVTQTIAAEGDGLWQEYAGGYTDWQRYQVNKQSEAAAVAEKSSPSTKGISDKNSRKSNSKAADDKDNNANKSDQANKSDSGSKPNNASSAKLSWKDRRELESMPQRIESLEAEQKELLQLLENPANYQTDKALIQQHSNRLGEIEQQLLSCLERWTYLESINKK